jgi:ketosteroid isomerase-like protein
MHRQTTASRMFIVMENNKKQVSKNVPDFDQVIQKVHMALREFVKGNPEPMKLMFSHREDVTLANPFGPPKRGWKQVSEIMDRAAAVLREGDIPNFDIIAKYVTPDLAFVVEIEWQKAKIGGSQDISPAPLRVTMIFRPEDGTWKILHRHADPITSAQPPESMIQK